MSAPPDAGAAGGSGAGRRALQCFACVALVFFFSAVGCGLYFLPSPLQERSCAAAHGASPLHLGGGGANSTETAAAAAGGTQQTQQQQQQQQQQAQPFGSDASSTQHPAVVPELPDTGETVFPAVAAAVLAAEREGRGRKLISMALYGDNPRYTAGVVENALFVRRDWGNWTLRVYAGEGVPEATLAALRVLGAELVRVTSNQRGIAGMFWRFYALEDASATRVIVRDADARLTPRDRAAVDEWVASGRLFHAMNDHPYHSVPILGGMWGAVGGLINPRVIRAWRDADRQSNASYAHGSDQTWLGSQGKLAQTLLYSEPGGERIHLTQDSDDIMNWIVNSERHVHAVFSRIFGQGCHGGLFVDAGANAGFYGVLAASYGCEVVFFEPQPLCINIIQRNLCLNGHIRAIVEGRFGIIPEAIAADPTPMVMAVPPLCRGSFSVKTGLDATAVPGPRTNVTTHPVSLDAVFDGISIFMIKIDTEGFEVSVLKTAMGMLRSKRVRHLLIEVAPVTWQRDGIISRAAAHETFAALLELQCTIKRVKQMTTVGDPDSAPALSPAALRAFIVEEQFGMEDVFITC
ncbi:hypothetical protein HT031_006231 [Scenedesmus sp. PABB004]|nr:hypothetical protein HT031_006231 [Scenedesmus sp. PABB004]